MKLLSANSVVILAVQTNCESGCVENTHEQIMAKQSTNCLEHISPDLANVCIFKINANLTNC